MNREQIQSLESAIVSVIKKWDDTLKTHKPEDMILWLDQCFAAKRIENLQENNIKRLENWLTQKDDEIRRHKTCIGDLRGYIDYLEKEKNILEQQINQE